ncbi:hypothetical protein SAMN06295912_1288 [Sphingomonas laterariae]|uniref:Uncharacterized protein n=2 Tax=Edaphosphingomonas laterariae TaxID=861865 RepID=A0A239IY93_9SPHN|nr:hypothetical protein SAMN06295912_1288 [Sphingomonas laterariae]
MSSWGADMDKPHHIYSFTWQGIEIEATYTPRKWSVVDCLEIRSVNPARAPLPITDTGYLCCYLVPDEQPETIAEDGSEIIAQIVAQLDAQARSREWLAYVEASKQGDLFGGLL